MNLVYLKGNWTKTKFTPVITRLTSLMKDQRRQLRERNVDATFLFAEKSSVQLNQFYVFTEISSCSKDFKKDCAALLLTRLTAF